MMLLLLLILMNAMNPYIDSVSVSFRGCNKSCSQLFVKDVNSAECRSWKDNIWLVLCWPNCVC